MRTYVSSLCIYASVLFGGTGVSTNVYKRTRIYVIKAPKTLDSVSLAVPRRRACTHTQILFLVCPREQPLFVTSAVSNNDG